MDLRDLVGFIVSILVLIFLSFRRKEEKKPNRSRERHQSSEDEEMRRVLKEMFHLEDEEEVTILPPKPSSSKSAIKNGGKRERKAEKRREAPKQVQEDWKSTHFPSTPEDLHHQLGNPWKQNSYHKKEAASSHPLAYLRGRKTLQQAVILSELLHKPRAWHPYEYWHVDR